MKSASKKCFIWMQKHKDHSRLIEPLSYDQVCAIHLYTMEGEFEKSVFKPLHRDIAGHAASKLIINCGY